MLSVPGDHPGHQEATIGAVQPDTVVRPESDDPDVFIFTGKTSYGPRRVGRELTFRKSVALRDDRWPRPSREIRRSVFTEATIGCEAVAAQIEAFCAVPGQITGGVTAA